MLPLNFDTSLPNVDPSRVPSNRGRVRYLTDQDALTLSALNRLQGDLAYRDNLLADYLNKIAAEVSSQSALTDVSSYVRADGTVGFINPINGATPTAPSHLATKSYVDASSASTLNSVTTLGASFNTHVNSNTLPFSSEWTEYTWQAGKKITVSLPIGTVNGKTLNPNTTSNVSLVERLDVSVPTLSVPNPTPVYVYRQVTKGLPGFSVEDYWLLSSPLIVKVLIPNLVSYDPSYVGSGYDNLQTPRTRHLRAVVFGNPVA